MKISIHNTRQWSAGNTQSEHPEKPETSTKKNWQLSKRELEVLNLVAKGLTASEVAEQLYLSLDTVETHKKNIVRKLEAKNSIEAVVKAVKMRLI
ncbi:MAG TPA: LuxR C-terminal-related transcriptional regulator [Chitinophagales bacterium]|nr:LuxR C-terminal-related transcriptional regulator [Chitinophagales bacterium]